MKNEDRPRATRSGAVPLVLSALVPVVLGGWLAMADTGGGTPSTTVVPDPVSDAVAATAAEFRVDESGAATYSIPIYTVPGTAGVMPQLSLSYSSQGGYGPLGKGWTVGGTSAISRCRATREAGDFISGGVPVDDGNPTPISYGASDRFCLDGQRLLPAVGGAACPAAGGMAVATMRTEIESFQRICAYTPSGSENGPAFFTVERKDGSISWYGDRDSNVTANRPDGYVETNAPGHTSKALVWAQTRFQDSTGNYIDYIYSENPGSAAGAAQHLLKQVSFTGKNVLPGQPGSALAPYASVIFNYASQPSADWGLGYSPHGATHTQRFLLSSVTSCAANQSSCSAGNQARHYVLAYADDSTGSGSRLKRIASVKECRSSSADAVCAPPTTFDWSNAKHDFASIERPASLPLANAVFRGFKMGDVNGDGRQDVVLQYAGGGGCASGTWIVSTNSALTPGGLATPANPYFNCVPANIVPRGDGGWHLLDYNGDGRDDLFVSRGAGQGWQVHPSTGAGFDMAVNLISGVSIPSADSPDSQPQLADLNGDGLVDVIYPRANALFARLMQRQTSGFGWGAERTIHVNEASIWAHIEPACNGGIPAGQVQCSISISGMPSSKTGFMQMADFNGDASSDVLMRVSGQVRTWTGYPGCAIVIERAAGEEPAARYYDPGEGGLQVSAAPNDPCWQTTIFGQMHALAVSGTSASTITLAHYGVVAAGSPEAIVPADANGDGLTDIFSRANAGSDWTYRINTGRGFTGSTALALGNLPDHARFADVNGDGRTDALYPVDAGGNKVYYARHALSGGGFAAGTPLPGGNARLCEGSGCDPLQRAPLFVDIDGDGNLDFLSLNFASSNLGVYVSRSATRFVPRDVVTGIVNGYGAVTRIRYAPLTNKDLYRRDSGSRNSNWGRGSPVTDLLAPMYAVAQASSSSPQPGNPNAMATVHYRYAGARMQAGGRGFLGFREIVTFDPNQSATQYVATGTTYRQDFPYVGMPESTVKRVVSGGYATPACLAGAYPGFDVTDACFTAPGVAFPSVGGSTFSSSVQIWQADTDITAADRDFAAGERRPVHVRTFGTEEILRDPFNGVNTSRVETLFVYGAYGNVTETEVLTKTGGGSLVSTVTTSNVYASDNASKWRLGRLTASSVKHSRPSRDDVVRTASFAYDMAGPGTGLMTAERVQSGAGASQDLRTEYVLNEFGNRIRVTKCAEPATSCSSGDTSFQPSSATRVYRYGRTVYDSRGRFPTETLEPFRSASGSAEIRTSRILGRDLFGNVTRAYDINGLDSFSVHGTLGRPYYTWIETVPGSTPGDVSGGVGTTTTYRWCQGSVTCPAGARFRQLTTTTAAPATWTYFDVLGRPILHVSQSFNANVSGKDATAVCTSYDAAGRTVRVSNPFFLEGTAGLAGGSGPSLTVGVCTALERNWTTTTYDVLGRPTRIDMPRDLVSGTDFTTTAYSGLTTTVTDPRGNATEQLRNALGELVRVTDALGTQQNYAYYADGTLYYTRRNVGRGNIDNVFVYDASGRKVKQTDPDSGITNYEYNALGELLAQVDSAGNRVEHWYDARGRVWRKLAKRADGLTESESLFVWDTAANGRGQLASESITGVYDAWIGQTGTALSFSRSYSYDPIGRPSTSTTVIDGTSYPTQVVYNELGQVWKQQDASGRWQLNQYGPRGHLRAVCHTTGTSTSTGCPGSTVPTDPATRTVLRVIETDAWGHVIREQRGQSDAMNVSREFWPESGRARGICAGDGNCSLVDEGYGWDAAGNLSTQIKEDRYEENFTYDALNRLRTARVVRQNGVTANVLTLSHTYDRLGNICHSFGFQFTYEGRGGCGLDAPQGGGGTGSVGPHRASRLTSSSGATTDYYYDLRGNQTVRQAGSTTRTIRYTLDDKAHEIDLNGAKTRFWYGPDGQRYKQERGGKRTLYLGNVEIETVGGVVTIKRTVAGVMLQTIVGTTATNRYLFHDHLGSLVRTTNASGTKIDELDYRQFGARRNFSDPTTSPISVGSSLTTRGFTGHEHVDAPQMDVIHMNGRIYDPKLGRFLQADPVIQAPGSLQSWNAYAYVFNNPLAYTDPTGMISIGSLLRTIAAIVISYYTGGWAASLWSAGNYAAAIAVVAVGGYSSGYVQTGSGKGGIAGAYSALLFFGAGRLAGTYDWSKGAQATAHGVAGGIVAELQGGKFGHAFVRAGLSKAVMANLPSTGNDWGDVAVVAIAGGTISSATGEKFANGAVTSAMQFAFNQMGQRAVRARVPTRTVSVHPKYGGELSAADRANMAAIDQSLADYADALRGGAGTLQDVTNYANAEIYYDPAMSSPAEAQTSNRPDINRVTYGSGIGGYAESRQFSEPMYYHGIRITAGGRAAMFAITGHEFGHVSPAGREAFRSYKGMNGRGRPAIEGAANTYFCHSVVARAPMAMDGVSCGN
jgi:RHS repeat-associated protein